MATLIELQTARDELLKRRRSGVARITTDGQTIQYRTQAEIDTALEGIKREIEVADGKKSIRAIRIVGSKGL